MASPRAELAGIIRFLGREVSDADLAFVGESGVELPRDHSVAARLDASDVEGRVTIVWRT